MLPAAEQQAGKGKTGLLRTILRFVAATIHRDKPLPTAATSPTVRVIVEKVGGADAPGAVNVHTLPPAKP